MTFKKVSVVVFFFLFCLQPLQAQNVPTLEYQVKAAFLFNFTRFINWPASAFKSDDSPFVIGIIGNDPFGQYLNDIVKGEQVNGHPITIERYNNTNEITNCQILFIGTNNAVRIKEIISATAHQNILTVSDQDNFTKLGGAVYFYKRNNKIQIEINTAATKTMQLDISAKLLRVAKIN